MSASKSFESIEILPQPDDVTCGPTSLHAVYRFHGLDLPLPELIEDVDVLEEGGTLAVYLGLDAISRGFRATIYTYNIVLFDPTWDGLTSDELIEKLEEQLEFKRAPRFRAATRAYQRFLAAGGRLTFEDLTRDVLQRYFGRGLPILAGLNATFLYRTTRERQGPNQTSIFDDLRGEPVGHFVVLAGMKDGKVRVADPHGENPSMQHLYDVEVDRLIHSILLGIVTYDANMLIIEPGAAG